MDRGSYQEKLGRQFNRYVAIVVLVFFAVLSALLLLHSFFITQYQNMQDNQRLVQTVRQTCRAYEAFLTSEDARETFLQRIRGESSDNYTDYFFNTFLLEAGAESRLILSDGTGALVYNSDEASTPDLHLRYFHSLLLGNLEESGGIYHTVYQRSGEMGEYVMALPLLDEAGDYAGAAAVFIRGGEWEAAMDRSQFDGVIVGGNDYVLSASNVSLLAEPVNRFHPAEGELYDAAGQRYRQARGTVAEYGITVYTFLHIGDLVGYYVIAALAICVLVGTLLVTGRSFSRRIANLNSASVETLHGELTAIQDRAGDHRITLRTGDEFEEIAEHINTMLDHLNALNRRNMELDRLNNQMERLQLEAQFDPHFLYNTLESIRYGIRLGDEGVDGLILKLTALLRYSISPAEGAVTLEEDLRHLQDYLDIIQYRFQRRFQFSVEMDPACLCHPCPRLLIQPMVENSVKYGLQSRRRLQVEIRGWQDERRMYIRIRDNGPGMDRERLEELRALIESPGDPKSPHHGLRNVARRLRLQFGPESGMELSSIPGEGTTVLLRVAHTEVQK